MKQNFPNAKALCKLYGIMLVLNASLLADNLYFIKVWGMGNFHQ